MIKETVTKVGNSSVCIDFVIDANDVDDAFKAARATVDDLKRRPLGEKQLGIDPEETERNAVAVRATRTLAEKAIREAVERNALRLATSPKGDIDALAVAGVPFRFSIELSVVPEFEIVGYENLKVELSKDFKVTEEDIDNRLEEVRGRSAQVEKDSSKPISENDIVELSFESFIDGESYEGSVAQGYAYTVGSEYLPREFEDGLIGLCSGDEKTIEFAIPDDYDNAEIAGKHARFDVKIKRVATCTLPEVNDEFARHFGYDDLATWRKKLENELAHRKEADHQLLCEKAAREALANCMTSEPSDDMIDAHAEKMLQAFKLDISNQGLAFEEYCSFLGLSEVSIRSQMKEESTSLLRENLALESLFRALGFKLTSEQIEKTVSKMAEESGMPTALSLQDLTVEQKAAVREMTMHRMATEWLLDHIEFAEPSTNQGN